MTKSKNSLILALATSFGICLGGAMLWAILYSFGFFTAIIAFAIVAIACVVYNKFYKINWIFFVWVIAWTILLCIAGMFIMDTIYLVGEFSISFGAAFELILQSIKTNSEVSSAYISNIIWTLAFIVIGLCCSLSIIKKQNLKRQASQQNIENFEENATVHKAEQEKVEHSSESNNVTDADTDNTDNKK